ncbi:MAG: ubiquinol-cytochrome C chaperone family protein [Pseudomonadota bacterium]
MFERAKEFAGRLMGRDGPRRAAHELYVQVAEAARRPEFYRDMLAPDTTEGRYDILSLHMILVLRRLKAERERTAPFAQLVFDVMFRDVDDSLREMGVGDLRVGKKVRGYAEAFFGRALAYEEALDGEGGLRDALSRNVFGDEDAPGAAHLAEYVRKADKALAEQSIDAILDGTATFPPILQGEME